ncbi:MAG: sensor histidine kinase [Saprospiraceae bacterium]
MNKKLIIIIQQLAIWVFIYLGYTLIRNSFYDSSDNSLSHIVNLINVPLFMFAYYCLKYVQIPKLYKKNKLTAFVFSLFFSALFIFTIYELAYYFWMVPDVTNKAELSFFRLHSFVLLTVRFYSPALALLAWDVQSERRKDLKRIKKLESEKLATELKFLKAQINPHFLFNTLNNLYSYVVTESPKAPDMIVRLTGILDYVLYKSQNKTVLLSEELETILHFLGLEQIRYGDRLQVNFRTGGDTSVPISPLILLSIVENAFKHGASGDIDQPKIEIDITAPPNGIRCRVWNTKSKHQGEINDAYKKGIGLSNIKRQLDLIYPSEHELRIDNAKEEFELELWIGRNKVDGEKKVDGVDKVFLYRE